MRVVPVEAGAVVDRERIIVRGLGSDERFAVAIVGGVHREAMPVRDGGLVEIVGKAEAHHVAAANGKQRIDYFVCPRSPDKGEAWTRYSARDRREFDGAAARSEPPHETR